MISAKAVSYTEGYRSGHNEAVLKTVWAHAHKGSNPFPSAKKRVRCGYTTYPTFILENAKKFFKIGTTWHNVTLFGTTFYDIIYLPKTKEVYKCLL